MDTIKAPSHHKGQGDNGGGTSSSKTRTPPRSPAGREGARAGRAPFIIQRTLSTAHDESGDSSFTSSQDRRGPDADLDIPVVPDPDPAPARRSPNPPAPGTTTPGASAGQKRPASDDMDDALTPSRAAKLLCDELSAFAAAHALDASIHAHALRDGLNRTRQHLAAARAAVDEAVHDQRAADELARRQAELQRRRAELAEEDAQVARMKEEQEKRKATPAPRLFG